MLHTRPVKDLVNHSTPRVQIAYPEYPNDHEKDNFKEVPVSVISDLEQYQFAGMKRIHRLVPVNLWPIAQKKEYYVLKA